MAARSSTSASTPLDRALYVLGHPTPLSVWGAIGRPFGNRGGVTNRWGPWDTSNYDVDDYAFAGIRFEGDLILLLECSWILRIGQSVERLTVSAADGGLEISPLRVFHDRDGFHSTEAYDTSGETRKEHVISVADFVRAVREGAEPTVTRRPGRHGHPHRRRHLPVRRRANRNPAGLAQTLPQPRSAIGITGRSMCPTYSARGRMIRLLPLLFQHVRRPAAHAG